MKKIVINKCYGGFSLSSKAVLWLWENGVKEIGTPAEEYYTDPKELKSRIKEWKDYNKNNKKEDSPSLFLTVFSPDDKYVLYARDIKRNNSKLIKCIEKFGEKANGDFAELAIVEIPNGVKWEIEEYDGHECVRECSRTWG